MSDNPVVLALPKRQQAAQSRVLLGVYMRYHRGGSGFHVPCVCVLGRQRCKRCKLREYAATFPRRSWSQRAHRANTIPVAILQPPGTLASSITTSNLLTVSSTLPPPPAPRLRPLFDFRPAVTQKISFDASEMEEGTSVSVDLDLVKERVSDMLEGSDLTKYII